MITNMGLGSKLGQLNNKTTQDLNSAKTPVANGGYNTKNVPALQQATPLSNADVQDVRQVSLEARNDYLQKDQKDMMSGRTVNRNGLQKPFVPTGAEYPDPEINAMVVEKMWRIVCLKELFSFYTQERLQALVNRACRHDYKILKNKYNIPTLDMTADWAVLGLYDIVLFVDDSGSMSTVEKVEGNLSRFAILREVIKTISFIGSLMDSDGICLRFFNSTVQGNGLSSAQQVDDLLKDVRPSGMTPMGEELLNKIFYGIVENPQQKLLSSGGLERPVLTITITDGVPNNENMVVSAITTCINECKKSKYGANAMAFSFAQIGTDSQATGYLGRLDTDPYIGQYIDCTSEFNIEKNECGAGFNESTWIVKLMIGAVDPAYDSADEGQQSQPTAQPYYQQSPTAQPYYQQSPTAQPYYQQTYQPPTGYPPVAYPVTNQPPPPYR